MTTDTHEDASAFVPAERTLPVLRKAVQECRGCDLYRYARQSFEEVISEEVLKEMSTIEEFAEEDEHEEDEFDGQDE